MKSYYRFYRRKFSEMFKFRKEAIIYNLTMKYWLLTIANIYSLQEWPPLPYTVPLNLNMSVCTQGTMPNVLTYIKWVHLNWHKGCHTYTQMNVQVEVYKQECILQFSWLHSAVEPDFSCSFFLIFKLFGFPFEVKTQQRECMLFFLLFLILLQIFFSNWLSTFILRFFYKTYFPNSIWF